jgi:hypothetical protein
MELEIPIGVDANGNPIMTKIKSNLTFDAIYSGLRNTPKINDMVTKGLSETEARIRASESKFNRNVMRFGLTLFNRTGGAIDGLFSRINEATNMRIAYNILLRNYYKQKNAEIEAENKANKGKVGYVEKPMIVINDRQIQEQVDEIIGFNNKAVFEKAATQAVKDVEGSLLWNQLGIKSFPQIDPRKLTTKSGLVSKEGKIYNEFVNRTYEIILEEKNQRLQEVLTNIEVAFDEVVASNVRTVDKYISDQQNSFTATGKPRGTMGHFRDMLQAISQKSKVLKYVGFPWFIDATTNFLSYTIDTMPGVNLGRLASYWLTGTRDLGTGIKKLTGKETENEIPFEPLRNYDRNNLTKKVLFFSLTAAAYLVSKYKDDEDDDYSKRIKQFQDGEFTGFTGKLPFSLKQINNKYEDFAYYVDGVKQFDYRYSPYFGYFNSLAFFDTKMLLSKDRFKPYNAEKPDEDLEQMLANYGAFQLETITEISTIKPFTDLMSDILNINKTSDKKIVGRISDSLRDKFATLVQNTIPKSSFLRFIQNQIDYGSDKNQKLAKDFKEKVMANMLYIDNLIESDRINIVGDEVKEQMRFKSPIGFAFPMDNDSKGNIKLEVFNRMNYSPPVKSQAFVNFLPDADLLAEMAEKEQADFMKLSDEKQIEVLSEKEGIAPSKLKERDARLEFVPTEIGEMIDKLAINYALDNRETVVMNQKANKMIGELIELTGYDGFTKRSLLEYKDGKALEPSSEYFDKMMGSAFNIARNSAIIEIVPDLIGKGYKAAVEKQIADWEAKYEFKMPESVKKNTKSN